MAGVSLACCSRPQRDNIDLSSLLLINVWVAVFQLISSILFLIGWIWSVIWGFSFITISSEFYKPSIVLFTIQMCQLPTERAVYPCYSIAFDGAYYQKLCNTKSCYQCQTLWNKRIFYDSTDSKCVKQTQAGFLVDFVKTTKLG